MGFLVRKYIMNCSIMKCFLCPLLIILYISAHAPVGATGPQTIERPEPEGALAWFKQGVELAQKGDYRSALSRFERARNLAPNWALPYLEIAVAHMVTDNDLEIIGSSLAKAVELGKDIPRAHYLYGIFHQERGKRRYAIKELTRALQLRPSLADARYRLATLFIEEGRQTDGIEQLQLLVKQKPAHVGAHRNLAVLFEQSGRLEEAERHLQAISRLFPDVAYHQTRLGRFYRRVGWAAKARAAFRKAERIESVRDDRNLRPLRKSRESRRRPDPMEIGNGSHDM